MLDNWQRLLVEKELSETLLCVWGTQICYSPLIYALKGFESGGKVSNLTWGNVLSLQLFLFVSLLKLILAWETREDLCHHILANRYVGKIPWPHNWDNWKYRNVLKAILLFFGGLFFGEDLLHSQIWIAVFSHISCYSHSDFLRRPAICEINRKGYSAFFSVCL